MSFLNKKDICWKFITYNLYLLSRFADADKRKMEKKIELI